MITAPYDLSSLAVQEELECLRRDYRTLVESIHDAVLFCSLEDEIIVEVNQQACDLYGFSREELVGMPLRTLLPDELAGDLRLRETGGGETYFYEAETVQFRKDGARLIVETHASVVDYQHGKALLLLSRDLTERKLLEEQFRQSQKMEAVGRLAGGVAHDFNNMLAVINGFAYLAVEMVSPDDPVQEYLDAIQKAGERAGTLTRQLLMFSRKQVLEPQPLDLNHLITELRSMLKRLIGEDFLFTTELAPKVGSIMADPGQIEQVIMNLVVNARDAMPQGGSIRLETRCEFFDEALVRTRPEASVGRYVVLSVTDTGIGMSPETVSRIFEPFFTTKDEGKGTGLGLATVYGIVQQAKGCLWVDSKLGEGTTFTICFPEDGGQVLALSQAAKETQAGSETILVVDDEDMIRSLLPTVLRASGYQVLVASGGEQAIKMIREHPDPIHLLLTDVVMPVMSGRELSERATVLRPDMRTLFMSGYTEDAGVRYGIESGAVNFLQKPFSPQVLTSTIRELLDERKRHAA